jgi:hypothetical protein
MDDLEALEHRVAQWHELPMRSVVLLDEARFAELVSEMEREVEEDAARRRTQRAARS